MILLLILTAAELRSADQVAGHASTPTASVERRSGTPSATWADGTREVEVAVRNETEQTQVLRVNIQLLQASSATAAAWSAPTPWRTVTLAPRQTSLEKATVQFPSVREPVTFLLRFTQGREVLGVVQIRIYPDRILRDLVPRLGPVRVEGLPEETLSVLSAAGWTLVPTGQLGSSSQSPRLAILGSACPADRVQALAQAGLGVIWLQPNAPKAAPTNAPFEPSEPSVNPSYYPVRIGKSVVMVVSSDALAGLARDPDAQRRLARITQLALGWETLSLPSNADVRVEVPARNDRN